MKVVTICGSMKFSEQMKKIATKLEIENSWCVIQCCYGLELLNPTQKEKDNIVTAHWKKIILLPRIGRKLTFQMQYML